MTLARNSQAGQQLAGMMERVIRVDAEIEALKADLREIYAEAKAFGLSAKVMRRCLKLRKIQLDDDKRGATAEFEELVATYMHALGWEGTPLWEAAIRDAERRDHEAEGKELIAAMRRDPGVKRLAEDIAAGRVEISVREDDGSARAAAELAVIKAEHAAGEMLRPAERVAAVEAVLEVAEKEAAEPLTERMRRRMARMKTEGSA